LPSRNLTVNWLFAETHAFLSLNIKHLLMFQKLIVRNKSNRSHVCEWGHWCFWGYIQRRSHIG